VWYLALMRSALATLFVVVAASGCNKDTQPAPEQPRSASNTGQSAPPAAPVEPGAARAEQAAPAEPPAANAGSSISEDSFALLLRPSGSYKVGQAGLVEVVLDAKAPYKVNDKYPYKFKLAPSAGLKFPNQVVKEEGLKLEQKRATMTVGFTPESSGQKNVSGQFSFSVCTEERCLIEKRDLSLAIDVQ
jgi:hypothetical protein